MQKLIVMLGALLCAAQVFASDHVVAQSNRAFAITSLQAKVGDTVTFRNDDAVAHNIFSLSETQSFDLGTYAKGAVRTLKLEKAGIIEIECAVHPDMKMVITVKP